MRTGLAICPSCATVQRMALPTKPVSSYLPVRAVCAGCGANFSYWESVNAAFARAKQERLQKAKEQVRVLKLQRVYEVQRAMADAAGSPLVDMETLLRMKGHDEL